jgi:hypothetical protein
MKFSHRFLLPIFLIVDRIGNAIWYEPKRYIWAGILTDKKP